MLRQRLRPLFALLAVAAALAFVAVEADAAPRFNAGSRGSRTFSAPASTATAPSARPIQRSVIQPGAATAARPGAAAPGGFLSRPGLLGGLAAGFLGAGLFGMLFGHGLFGGLGGLASMFGLLLQIGIVVLVARLAWNWWQRRNQPAFAGGRPSESFGGQRPGAAFNGLGGGFGGSAPPAADTPVEVKPADFDAFERLLGEIQTAYGREDVAALRAHVTPEMLSYYSEELAQNSSRGVVNEIGNVKLLQGDLSEAWSEGQDEYATVAMRYSLDDRYVDRASGKVVEDNSASEATELWTFRRARGGDWMLSAIQQA
jgi:predicted lipid-binding transport protein (Tim44 family)